MGGVLEGKKREWSRPDWYLVEITRLLNKRIVEVKKQWYEKERGRMRGRVEG
jgi:hypothetical protein